MEKIKLNDGDLKKIIKIVAPSYSEYAYYMGALLVGGYSLLTTGDSYVVFIILSVIVSVLLLIKILAFFSYYKNYIKFLNEWNWGICKKCGTPFNIGIHGYHHIICYECNHCIINPTTNFTLDLSTYNKGVKRENTINKVIGCA